MSAPANDTNDTPELYEYAPRIILLKLREELDALFRVYYYGDPFAIPNSHFPCLIVDWQRSDPQAAPTRSDKWKHNIVIKAVVPKMDDVGAKMDPETRIVDIPTRSKLERLMFARDGTTGQYLDTSVLGVLRKNYTMGGKFTLNESLVEFGTSPRTSDEGKPIVTAEAHITLTLNETIRVPNRT